MESIDTTFVENGPEVFQNKYDNETFIHIHIDLYYYNYIAT